MPKASQWPNWDSNPGHLAQNLLPYSTVCIFVVSSYGPLHSIYVMGQDVTWPGLANT